MRERIEGDSKFNVQRAKETSGEIKSTSMNNRHGTSCRN